MVAISVVMANYNGGELLKEAVSSILNQTFRDFEFIIIDDGSNDGSIKYITKICKTDTRVKFLKNETNLGLPTSLNKAIRSAQGEFIARMDADDLSDLSRLEKQLLYIRENNLELCGTSTRYISESGISLCCDDGPELEIFTESLFNQVAIFSHGSAMFRKSTAIDLGLYNESFFYTQDMEFWLRFIFSDKKVGKIKEPLYSFRIQKDNASLAKVQGQTMYTQFLKEKYLNLPISFSLEEINEKIQELRKVKRKKSPLLLEYKYKLNLFKNFVKKITKYKNYY